MNKRILGLLSAGHLVNDLHQGALPALLPFLLLEHGLTYSTAAIIVFAFTGTSTIIQPVFGLLSDRFSRSWIIPAGIILTATGFAMIGLASSYSLLILAVIISGVGSAVFHPEAAKMVNYAGGSNKATAMSLFGVGGVLGFSIGPFIITTAVLAVGLKGAMLTLIPVFMVSAVFFLQSSQLETLQLSAKLKLDRTLKSGTMDRWLPFTLLSLTIIGKSIIYYGLFTFIPLYWTTVLGQSQMAGGLALTTFSAAGVIGNLAGGRLADHFGQRRIIVSGCLLLVPALPAFLWADNVLLATLMLFVVGALLLSTYGPTIVLGQRYLPNNIGFSSGMTLGVAFSMGGMVAPLLGHLADQRGLPAALMVVTFIPIFITLLAATLPSAQDESECLQTAEL